jgi:hypothetical protein
LELNISYQRRLKDLNPWNRKIIGLDEKGKSIIKETSDKQLPILIYSTGEINNYLIDD